MQRSLMRPEAAVTGPPAGQSEGLPDGPWQAPDLQCDHSRGLLQHFAVESSKNRGAGHRFKTPRRHKVTVT